MGSTSARQGMNRAALNATMLTARETEEESASTHLRQAAELADETHGFVTFIPLAFHRTTRALATFRKPTGYAIWVDTSRARAVERPEKTHIYRRIYKQIALRAQE